MRICMLIFLFISWGQVSLSQTETKPESTLYPDGLISLSNDPHYSQYAFVVDKSARTLRVYESQGDLPKLIVEHPTDIGKSNGDKERANDFKTPVGMYFLLSKKTQPEIPFDLYGNLAFTTDYPNIFDQRVAKSGSGIWLHAIPDTVPLTRGSRGCVVVRNDVIKSLEKFVKLEQTPIIISDKVNYITAAEYKTQKEKYLQHFEAWRKSWENQDVDSYIQFYDPTFKNNEMNFKQWYRHKKKLKALYKYIKVQLLAPVIIRNKEQVVIRTAQRYESDLHQDYGEKTIHAHYSDATGFKIIREDWKPLAETANPQTSSLELKTSQQQPN